MTTTSHPVDAEPGGPLYETSLTATDYWNDSCSIDDLSYAIARGAVGATSNPTIVTEVLRREMDLWRERIAKLITDHHSWTEDEVTWALIEEVAVGASTLLLDIFEREQGRKGRLSIQTDPRLYRNAAALVEQARHFDTLAPNLQVKVPATRAGIAAIEEITAAGISINATVCFTVPQAVAVAEAVERGLSRCETCGIETARMSPVCTIMIGRLDDWMSVLIERDSVMVNPGIVHWAGIATFKQAYGTFRQRGYRTKLLAAAYRHHMHWSELIGGDILMTIPPAWQRKFNASDIAVVPRFDEPPDEQAVAELYRRLPDFRRAYDAEGMSVDEFDLYGATVRTLRGFISSYHELVASVRDMMLPNPDRR